LAQWRKQVLDLDADGKPGSLSLDEHRVEQLLVAGDPGAAVDAQRLLAAGHQEDQPDVPRLSGHTALGYWPPAA
jgi:hypothetical protein